MLRNCLCAAVVAITANGFFLRYLMHDPRANDDAKRYQARYHQEGESLFITPDGLKSFSEALTCSTPTFTPILQSSVYWRSGHGYSVDRSMSVVKNPKDFLPILSAVVMREYVHCKVLSPFDMASFKMGATSTATVRDPKGKVAAVSDTEGKVAAGSDPRVAASFGMGRKVPTSPRFWRRHFGQGKRMQVQCQYHQPLLTDAHASPTAPSGDAQGNPSASNSDEAEAGDLSPSGAEGGHANPAFVPDASDTTSLATIGYGIATEGAVATKWEHDRCPKKTKGSLFESLAAKHFYVPVSETTKDPDQNSASATFKLMQVPVEDAKKPTLCTLEAPTTLKDCRAWKKDDNYQKGDLVFLKRPVWWKERTQVHLQMGTRKPIGTVFLVLRPHGATVQGVGEEIHVAFGGGAEAIFAKKRGGWTLSELETGPVHLADTAQSEAA